MKINLPIHKIKDTERLDAKDIPVGYIDTTDASYDISFSLYKDFSVDEKKQVFAYDVFKDKDIFLFDGNRQLLKNIRYKREGSNYIYEPTGCKEFQPTYFRAKALVHRHMSYRSDNHYNIKVGVVETDPDSNFAANIMPAFGDANKRGLCPGNITVNSGSKMIQSLIKTDIDEADFIFLQTPDGKDTQSINVNNIVDKHVNVWMSAQEFAGMLELPAPGLVPQKEGRLCSFYKETDRKKYPPQVFKTSDKLEHPNYPRSVYEYSFPYEDVLVMHKRNGGYIIVTPLDFLSSSPQNTKIIYDVMMYVFMNSYKQVLSEESWITNEQADYMSCIFTPLKTYHKSINLNEMLAVPDYDLGDEYEIVSIGSTTPNIACVKITADKTLFFRKNSKAEADPKKPDGAITYITTKGTALIYEPEEVYQLKSRASLTGKSNNNVFAVTLAPLMDSEKHIYIPKEVSLQIPNPNKEWCVCVKSAADGLCEPKLIEQGQYSMRYHGYRIADVHIEIKHKPQIIDVRVKGGGLPINEEDNYDCIDIGNIYGRPYRLGATIVIRLPRRLKEFENIIDKAVKEHIAAGEYPVILFE